MRFTYVLCFVNLKLIKMKLWEIEKAFEEKKKLQHFDTDEWKWKDLGFGNSPKQVYEHHRLGLRIRVKPN